MAGDRGRGRGRGGGMFWFILFKSLKIRKKRVWVALFSIALGAAIISSLSSVYLDISAKMSRELRAYGANFFIGPATSSGRRSIDQKIIENAIKIFPADKLVATSPYLYGIVRLDLGNAVLAGINFSEMQKLSPYWQLEGRWINVDFDESSCIIGKSLAKSMELKVGDQVNITNTTNATNVTNVANKSLTIKGMVETGQVEDEQLFVNLSLAARILGEEGRVNHAMLSIIDEGIDVDALALEIQKRFPLLDARPIRKISHTDGKILDKIKGLMAMVAIIILVVTTLGVMSTLMATVLERRCEIGLMKALGANDHTIIRQFLVETLIMGVVGAGVGLLVGFILAQLFGQAVFNSDISFRLMVIPVTLISSTIVSLLAAAIPIRMAVRIMPAQVLKEN